MSRSKKPENSSLLERATRFHAIRAPKYHDLTEDDLREELLFSEWTATQKDQELQRVRRERDGAIHRERQASQRENNATQKVQRSVERLQKQTARVEKFKFAYESLKASPEVSIGRAAIGPVRKLRRMMKKSASVHGSGNTTEVSPTVSTDRGGPAPESVPNDRGRWTEIKRLYFQSGQITEPYRRIADAPVPPSEEIFTAQLSAAHRLLQSLPELPARQPNSGYFPVRGKILYCAHSTGKYNSNGYSTRTAGLTRAMALDGDVVVVARPGYPWDAKTTGAPGKLQRFERVIDGVKHAFNPGPSLKNDPLDHYFEYAADIIAREALIQRAETIHAASNHVTALPALMAARRLGLPFVYEVRGLWEITEASAKPGWIDSERFQLAAGIESLVARNADQVLAITRQVRDRLIERGVESGKIELLPNAADPYEFVPLPPEREVQRRLGLEATDIVVGYAGSVLEYEGPTDLLRAFAEALTSEPNLLLLIVGDGPALSAMKAEAETLAVSNRVIFTGRIPAADVPRFMTVMDIVVCPRISNLVTEMVSPLKPLEAMAAGRAIVASDVAPLADIFGDDDDRGLLFAAGNPRELAKRILELSAAPSRREDLGRNARTWVIENRSWAVMADLVHDSHRRLSEQAASTAVPAKGLGAVTVALVSDEFTRSSLRSECNLVLPEPKGWKALLAGQSVDVLIVESAWEGNEGAWAGKIGYYDDESFADLNSMVSWCREQGIPTVFWNKEDPIHFNRFRRTAKIFDHVFTTDAGMIPSYLNNRGSGNKTIASLPFWAQSRLHNPLPGHREPDHSVAYGGTYYGERYPDRSRVLSMLLDAVSVEGITIYDRQANLPGSPYRYPDSLEGYVQGGLSYPEMVEAYKAHPVHLNVNSVVDSPTMFSRRVIELAATGTPIISGPGRGVAALFAGLVPTPNNPRDASLIAEFWMNNEMERNADAWKLHRYAYRAHMASHRLSYVLRTAGLVVQTPELPAYALRVARLDPETSEYVLGQTHRPAEVLLGQLDGNVSREACASLGNAGIRVMEDSGRRENALPVLIPGGNLHDPTLAEDLCRASQFHDGPIQMDGANVTEQGKTLWEYAAPAAGASRLLNPDETLEGVALILRRRVEEPEVGPEERDTSAIAVSHEPRRILVAGHDLKFAAGIMEWLNSQGHHVTTDIWTDHSKHDPDRSRQSLTAVDTIFCEWSLGNLEWYATNRLPSQRLVSRFHSQELFTPHMKRLDKRLVDHTVFVGELIQQVAIRRFGFQPAKTSVIPNALGVPVASEDSDMDRRFTLGLVGMVPRQKHLDRALELLALLRETDERFTLRVKGRLPEEYPWMQSRREEMAFYERLFSKIDHDPRLHEAVVFDGHGNDMAEWYAKIGVAISVSDFEAFHLTLADGAASNALPVSLAWPGAENIYPAHWLHSNVSSMAETILGMGENPGWYQASVYDARGFAASRFSPDAVHDDLGRVILGPTK